MKNFETTLQNGKRILINIDQIQAVIERHPGLCEIQFSMESFIINNSFDDTLKVIPCE